MSFVMRSLIVLVVSVVVPSIAGAQPVGTLFYQLCIGGRFCMTVDGGNGDPLSNPARVVITPDGSSVYVAASGWHCDQGNCTYRTTQISHLRLHGFAAPVATFNGCIGSDPPGCRSAEDAALLGLVDMVALNDGVYALSSQGDITHFWRASGNGSLYYFDCLGDPTHGCTAAPQPLANGAAIRLAASADGKFIYVLSNAGRGAVVALARSPAAGTLSYASCVGDGAVGCSALPAGVSGVFGSTKPRIIPSSDSATNDIWVSTDGVLSRFSRASDGSLALAQCFGSGSGVTGCQALPLSDDIGNRLDGARDIASANNGASLFVLNDHSVARFDRQPSGFVYQGCFGTQTTNYILGADNSAYGCTPFAASPTVFSGLVQLSASNDGSSGLYAISGGGAIVQFTQSGTYQQCWGGVLNNGCVNHDTDSGARIDLANGLGLAQSSDFVVAVGSSTPSMFDNGSDGSAYVFARVAY
jgi:hypothetical protein